MATIRKHRGKWQVQVRRGGYPSFSRSFHSKQDAERWGREQERSADLGIFTEQGAIKPPSILADLICRYKQEVSVLKRSRSDEFHFRQIERHYIGSMPISKLTSSAIANYRDERLKSVSKSTVRKELNLLGNLIKIARNEWGVFVKSDIVTSVRKPENARSRDRRLDPDEIKIIHQALLKNKNKIIPNVFEFALATGMRRGEILSLDWSNIDFKNKIARLTLTKNGEGRDVPLGPNAMAVLQRQMEMNLTQLENSKIEISGLVFDVSANALRLAWDRVMRQNKIENLRLHDLRHEAISTFFEMGLSVPEVALISGHKDVRMLIRYTHLRAGDIVKKLM
jgi:integrase